LCAEDLAVLKGWNPDIHIDQVSNKLTFLSDTFWIQRLKPQQSNAFSQYPVIFMKIFLAL
jgi:hypothetical protein